jgi:hypothetical protein
MYICLCPFFTVVPICFIIHNDPLPVTTFLGAIQQQQMMPPYRPYPYYRRENAFSSMLHFS